jgi:hypothetical protein
MLLANNLDVQYVWIDAVCIIQDTKDLEDQIPKMGLIYEQAFLVVAADCAESVHAGFLRPRNEYSHLLFTPSAIRNLDKKLERRTLPYVSINPADNQDTQIFFHNDNTCGHEFLVWNKPELSRTSLAANPVFYRAWCMQERLLAHRVIHFTVSEIVWECMHLVDCECGELRRRGIRDSIKQNMYPLYVLAEATDDKIDIDTAPQWQHIIEDYTVGELTVEGDRLVAIAGFARKFQNYHSWRYFAGLWEKYFQSCLIWEVVKYEIDRPERNFGNYVAPSWSWASARSPVKYAASIDGAILVAILEARCEPKIERDPFCGIRSGRIVWRGPMLRANMELQDGEALCHIVPDSLLKTTMIVTLDINSPERQDPNNPGDRSSSVLLVLIGASPSSSPHQTCFTVLLLRQQSDHTFVRIGLGTLQGENLHADSRGD